MKAYCLSIKDEDDAGCAIVFANTVKEAKKQVWSHDTIVDALDGGWITLQAHRAKHYDGMENLDAAHLALEQWKEGWRWFDVYAMPDNDETTDNEFVAWYEKTFGKAIQSQEEKKE